MFTSRSFSARPLRSVRSTGSIPSDRRGDLIELGLNDPPDFTAAAPSESRSTTRHESEFGHRELRNDFGLWEFGYV